MAEPVGRDDAGRGVGRGASSAVSSRPRLPPALSSAGPRVATRPIAARPVSAKTVGSFVPRLTQKAFERFGFPAAAILTDWPAIVGREIAEFTRPERLKWPRGQAGYEGAEDEAGAGATLVLRVEGPRALEIQHRGPQILEQINSYFGFRAVSEMRILQAPLVFRHADLHMARTPERPKPSVDVSGVKEEGLRQALERLGQGVAGRREPSPRGAVRRP